jgi:hypothetical protein
MSNFPLLEGFNASILCFSKGMVSLAQVMPCFFCFVHFSQKTLCGNHALVSCLERRSFGLV